MSTFFSENCPALLYCTNPCTDDGGCEFDDHDEELLLACVGAAFFILYYIAWYSTGALPRVRIFFSPRFLKKIGFNSDLTRRLTRISGLKSVLGRTRSPVNGVFSPICGQSNRAFRDCWCFIREREGFPHSTRFSTPTCFKQLASRNKDGSKK
jgi:hypothetical protein